MASGKSDYAENRILNFLFGQHVTITPPATWYVGLFRGTGLGDAGGGTEMTLAGGYARKDVANTSASGNFPSTSTGVKTNGNDIVFATSTAAWDAGALITAAALFDAVTGGNMWYWGDIAGGAQQSITATNQQFVIPAGALTITED